MEKHTEHDALDRALTNLYHTEVPRGFGAAWREAVQREEQTVMKKHLNQKTGLRVALSAAAAIVLVVGALGAGSLIPTVVTDTLYGEPSLRKGVSMNIAGGAAPGDSAPSMAFYTESGSTYAMSAAPVSSGENAAAPYRSAGDEAAPTSAGTPQTGAKIVRTADLTIATTSFDADTDAVESLTQSMGGYVASVSLNGEASARKDRVAYYSLRIPSDKLDAFLEGMGGIGRITARSESATDMTTQYSDTQLRLSTQQTKMTRLQDLLKQAADVSDLLEIETEIADTQYELDQLESTLRGIDRSVDHSDVTLTLLEQSAADTAQAVELTLWQRLGSGFDASVKGLAAFAQNLLVFLAMLLPVLVPVGIVTTLVVWLVRKRRNATAQHVDPAQTAPAAPTEPDTAGTEDNTPKAGQ